MASILPPQAAWLQVCGDAKLSFKSRNQVNGNDVSGTAEKVWELSDKGGEREYVGKNRSTATISGHVKSKILGKHELVINLNENGHGRQYSTQHLLVVEDSNSLSGRFTSTAANQVGTCNWIRKST
jgi:hypothetical protein